MTSAKTFLEKRYSDEMEIEDAISNAIRTLKEGFEVRKQYFIMHIFDITGVFARSLASMFSFLPPMLRGMLRGSPRAG